jgi:hypothetical protein
MRLARPIETGVGAKSRKLKFLHRFRLYIKEGPGNRAMETGLYS